MTAPTERERQLAEDLAEARFQLKVASCIGFALLLAFFAALSWR